MRGESLIRQKKREGGPCVSKMSDEVFSNVMHDPVVGLMHAPCSLLHTGKFCSKKPYYCIRVKICSKTGLGVFSNVMHDPVVGLMHAPCRLLNKGKFCSKKFITASESKFVQNKLLKYLELTAIFLCHPQVILKSSDPI